MPPRPTQRREKLRGDLDKLDRLEREKQLIRELMSRRQDAFEQDFQALHALAHAQNKNLPAIKNAFEQLEPRIGHFIGHINQLKDPKFQAILTDNDKDTIAFFQGRIGTAYLYADQLVLAREYLNEVRARDYNLGALVNLIIIETDPAQLTELREELLLRSQQPKHHAQAAKIKGVLRGQAEFLLDKYIAEDSPRLVPFFMTYKDLVSLHYLERFAQTLKHRPEELVRTRSLLFQYLLTHPQEKTIKDLQRYLAEQSLYFIQQKKPFQLFNHLKTNYSLFVPGSLAIAINLLLKEVDRLPSSDASQASDWLTALALKTSEPEVLTSFLKAFHANRNLFKAESALLILDKASYSENNEVYVFANLLLGDIYNEGYSSLPIDYDKAFPHYKNASDRDSLEGLMRLADMYNYGKGCAKDLSEMKRLCERAHRLDCNSAAAIWAEALSVSLSLFSPEESKKELLSTLKWLLEAELRLDLITDPEQLQTINLTRAKIAYHKAECLVLVHGYNIVATIPTTPDNCFNIVTVNSAIRHNPEIIQALVFAAANGSEKIQFHAAYKLGQYYSDESPKQDLEKALSYFKQAIAINKAHQEYVAEIDYLLSIQCSIILRLQSQQETLLINKRQLQFKALNFYHQAMSIYGDDIPTELKNAVDFLAQKHRSDQISPEATTNMLRLMSRKFAAHFQTSWTQALTNLKTLLNNDATEKTPQKLLESTTAIEVINENLLDEPSLFPQLGQFVSACVANVHTWQDSDLLEVFNAVSKWHLSSATAALEPLFMHIQHRLLGKNIDQVPYFSFENCCKYIKFIAQCNFTAEVQERNVPDLLRTFTEKQFKQALSTKSYTAKDLARLFYGLALLDCNKHNELYLTLAEQIYTELTSQCHDLESYDISEIYHAYKYFKAHHKVEWNKGNLLSSFETYETALCADIALPSKTQEKIYQRLLWLYPNTRQEVFIESAGRRVDFVIDGIVIQYNGARRHYVADDNGRLRHSLKERLALKTLKHVVCIDRDVWNALGNDEREDQYLRNLVETAKQQMERRATKDEPDEVVVIRPFFPKTARGGQPRPQHAAEEKKVEFVQAPTCQTHDAYVPGS